MPVTAAGIPVALMLFVGSRRDQREPVEVLSSDDATHRVLVIANKGLEGEPLTSALRSGTNGSLAHVRVIVPGLAAGFNADGLVGDADPTQALEDALKTYPADEVIVVNPDEGRVGRMERAATLRAKDATPLPFTVVRAG